jgi:hypothetical protein
VLAVALILAACSGGDAETDAATESADATASQAEETVEPTESASADDGGTATSVFDLEVGDCFDVEDETSVDEVTVLDCEQPHDYEIYALEQHPAGPNDEFPGDDAISSFADEACLGSTFEDYVGQTYEDSELYAFTLQPTAETWEVGDREVVCSAFLQDGKLEGSVEGSGR